MRVLLIAALALGAGAAPALAQDSAANASAAGGASSEAAGHLAAAGVQAVVGVAAVPVSVAAAGSGAAGSAAVSVGAGSAAVGGGLSEAAGASADRQHRSTAAHTASSPTTVREVACWPAKLAAAESSAVADDRTATGPPSARAASRIACRKVGSARSASARAP